MCHFDQLTVADQQTTITMDFTDKLLKKVLSYIPNRRYAAQVNLQFYRVVCSLDDEQDIYKLKLDGLDGMVKQK